MTGRILLFFINIVKWTRVSIFISSTFFILTFKKRSQLLLGVSLEQPEDRACGALEQTENSAVDFSVQAEDTMVNLLSRLKTILVTPEWTEDSNGGSLGQTEGRASDAPMQADDDMINRLSRLEIVLVTPGYTEDRNGGSLGRPKAVLLILLSRLLVTLLCRLKTLWLIYRADWRQYWWLLCRLKTVLVVLLGRLKTVPLSLLSRLNAELVTLLCRLKTSWLIYRVDWRQYRWLLLSWRQ